MTTPRHRAETFLELENGPREGETMLGDERATLTAFLRQNRLTLRLKREGLNAEQLACRAVWPANNERSGQGSPTQPTAVAADHTSAMR